ncbi:Lipase/lipooxygenase PLAT/LH2 family protein [Euphorbia peplus]|nr:Lipase/lipooxygenase PLAT/LH2 family protein [Euphorbia peplus]
MAMESISPALFSFNNNNFQLRNKFSTTRNGPRRSIILNYQRFHYDYQDFQAYAKPSRLLGATEPKVCLENFQERKLTSLSEVGSESLYKVKLQTSNAYGSSLSDENAGILLCLIDANGDSILQRIPVLLTSNSSESNGLVELQKLHFQRGSIDELIFKGPKLEGIEALWISIESGQWRFGGASLTVISSSATPHSTEKNDSRDFQITALQYEFEVDDILLGEGCDIAMVELRPTLVSDLSGADPSNLLSKTPSESTAPPKDTMREYTDLKLSLLSYDAALILLGTIVANFSSGENESYAFFIGGIGGFLYLLLLQRSVDSLEASSSISGEMGRFEKLFSGSKGLITGLALALGLTSLALKYVFGDVPVEFTSKELLFGMMGFLGCKVAVVLAAFRPLYIHLEETEN